MSASQRDGRSGAAEQGSSGLSRFAAWLTPAYVVGLTLVLLGERVLIASELGRLIATGLGVLLVLGVSALRFVPALGSTQAQGPTQAQGSGGLGGAGVARLLQGLSLLGVVALGVYFATTEPGRELLGLARGTLSEREQSLAVLQVAWVSLMVLAVVPLVFAELALRPMRAAPRVEGRRVTLAATAGLSLSAALVYCSLFVYAAGASDVKLDFSYFKTSAPSESTRRIAESLTEPVRVVAFFPDVNEVRGEVKGYLDELAKASPHFQVEIHDRLLAPGLARELRVTQDGVIVLTRGTVTEVLRLGTELRPAARKLKTLDRDLQERLLKVVRKRRVAYLTVGHGELGEKPLTGAQSAETAEWRGATILKKQLEAQNYLVKNLGLGDGLGSQVPEDATLVLVLGPTEPFAAEELASLRAYAERGGKLFIAVDPDVVSTGVAVTADGPAGGPGSPADGAAPPGSSADGPAGVAPADGTAAPGSSADEVPGSAASPGSAAPGQAAPPAGSAAPADVANPGAAGARGAAGLAELVGVSLSPGVLANDSPAKHLRLRYNDSDRALLPTNEFSSHASVSTLGRNAARVAVVVRGAGSLVQVPGAPTHVDFAVRSRSGTFADLNGNFSFDSGEERKVFNLAAAVTQKASTPAAKPDEPEVGKPLTDPSLPQDMRAFVLADADALSDFVMGKAPSNQLLFVDVVRWLGGEESFAGEATSEEDVPIEHTKDGDTLWFYSTILGAPLLVLGLGLWLGRRRSPPRRAARARSGGDGGARRTQAEARRPEQKKGSAADGVASDGASEDSAADEPAQGTDEAPRSADETKPGEEP
ncbi:MAG: Gldg family protein [Polyangiaceae bacterium]|nr:Gldg family protein [Polyangiaceae bacterium]